MWLRSVAFAICASDEIEATHEVLEQYNALLKSDLLVAPEQAANSVDLDFHELNQIGAALLQGAPVQAEQLLELRAHVRSVREQIRRWKRNTIRSLTVKIRGD